MASKRSTRTSSRSTRSGRAGRAGSRRRRGAPPSQAAPPLALSVRFPDGRHDRARLRLPARDGRPRQLLRGQRELPRLRRNSELSQRRGRPRLRHVAGEQPEAACDRTRDDGAGTRDRALPQLAHPRLARLPGDRLLPLHPPGDGDRARLLVPAAAERDAEHAPARCGARRDRARLARVGARRDVLDRRADPAVPVPDRVGARGADRGRGGRRDHVARRRLADVDHHR